MSLFYPSQLRHPVAPATHDKFSSVLTPALVCLFIHLISRQVCS